LFPVHRNPKKGTGGNRRYFRRLITKIFEGRERPFTGLDFVKKQQGLAGDYSLGEFALQIPELA
jgi:hypothetical protein